MSYEKALEYAATGVIAAGIWLGYAAWKALGCDDHKEREVRHERSQTPYLRLVRDQDAGEPTDPRVQTRRPVVFTQVWLVL